MSGIQHEYTLNAVTALALYQPRDGQALVFAGEGCFLKVFDAVSSRLVAQCKIFSAQVVHGIALSDPASQPGGGRGGIAAAFWGGKSFVLLGADEVEAIARGGVGAITVWEDVAPDWILDGAVSPFRGSEACVFVTAHSAALRVNRADSSGRITLKALPSLSRSILYSAHVVWTGPGSIMVAGGTVFGEVEVSEWQQIRDDALVRSRHIYTFNGHEGSVFGVRISPEILGRNGRLSRYLASCSDDRTIRVWNISVHVSEKDSPDSELESSALIRETGFRVGKLSLLDDPLDDPLPSRCIAVRMAHASRIWRVEFVAWKKSLSEFPTKVHVLSFGEDSTCQQWAIDFLQNNISLEGGSSHKTSLPVGSIPKDPAVLTHLKTFAYHSGKHIWSTAMSFVSETSRHLVTGGADGQLAFYNIFLEAFSKGPPIDATGIFETRHINFEKQNIQTVTHSWTLKDILRDNSLTKKISENSPTYAKKQLETFQMLDTLDATTLEKGMPSQKNQKTKDAPNRYAFVGENELLVTTSFGRILFASLKELYKWEELDIPKGVENALRSYSLLVGAPAFGIALLAGANGATYLYHKKKVTELMKVNGKPAALLNISMLSEERLGFLVTILGSDIAHKVSITISALQSPSLKEVISIKLPSSFIATCATNILGFLILGGRNGSIALYNLANSKEPTKINYGQEMQAGDAITSIIAIPSQAGSKTRCHFLATSRDGSYYIFSLSVAQSTDTSFEKVVITLVHRAFPPVGPMIEAAWFSDTDLLLFGFRGTSFIVWNESKQCEISSIECGGGHRSYCYITGTKTGGAGHFAYTKASRLYIHSQACPSHQTLKPGGHGREIKAAAIHKDFVATGAEDTVIRIWRIHKKGGEPQRAFITIDGEGGKYGNTEVECCAVLEKHTAGIQHLQWSCSSDDYHSLFSAGGAEEFHVWAVSNIPGFGVGVVCEATLTDLSEDRDLRIMGFDVEFIYNTQPHRKTEGGSNGKNEITLIYSDSTIRCYDYSRGLGFKKTAQGKYTSACLTQIVCLGENLTLQKFFTTSTDGHLALWERLQRSSLGRHAFSIQPLLNDAPIPPIPELKLILRLKLHQSSISAIAIQHLTLLRQRDCLLVATAGDDNAICIAFFHKLLPTKRMVIPSAHAAGITGLAFKSDMTGGKSEDKWIQLWTVGGDQRVKRWTIEFGLADYDPKPTVDNGLNMRISGQGDGDDVWCSVADPGGLVQWRDNWEESHALVFGNGMEVFKLKDGFPDGTGMRWAGFKKGEPKQDMAKGDVGEIVARHDNFSA